MQTQQIVEPTIIDPEAVADFHERRGTAAVTRQAVRLVQETFTEIQSISIQAVKDFEEDAEWLRLTVDPGTSAVFSWQNVVYLQ